MVWGDSTLFYEASSCPSGHCQSYSDFEFALIGVDNRSGAQSRSVLPGPVWRTGLWLTQRGSALITLGTRVGSPTAVREIDPTGAVQMECPLGLSGIRQPRTNPILSGGRYAMITGLDSGGGDHQLDVWLLPGYSPASSGWVSPRGGVGLDSRAR